MKHLKRSGLSIAVGGFLLIVVNAVLTPLLASDVSIPEMLAASQAKTQNKSEVP